MQPLETLSRIVNQPQPIVTKIKTKLNPAAIQDIFRPEQTISDENIEGSVTQMLFQIEKDNESNAYNTSEEIDPNKNEISRSSLDVRDRFWKMMTVLTGTECYKFTVHDVLFPQRTNF